MGSFLPNLTSLLDGGSVAEIALIKDRCWPKDKVYFNGMIQPLLCCVSNSAWIRKLLSYGGRLDSVAAGLCFIPRARNCTHPDC